jgi:hypothetical protein
MKSKSVKTKAKSKAKAVKKPKVPASTNPLYSKFGNNVVDIEGNENGAIIKKVIHITLDQIKRMKHKGKYAYWWADYDDLMGTIVHLVSMCNKRVPFGMDPIEVTDFAISLVYKTAEVAKHPKIKNMQPMVNGSHKLAWRRPGDKE